MADRINGAFTMFLAAFALMYVVSENVPRLDFLTCIDMVIYLTIMCLLSLAIESAVVYLIHEHYSEQLARKLDIGLGVGIACTYLMAVGVIILRGVSDQRAAVRRLDAEGGDTRPPPAARSKSARRGSIDMLWRTLKGGSASTKQQLGRSSTKRVDV